MAAVKHILLAKTYSRKGRQLSQAFNTYTKSHPLQAKYAHRVGCSDKIYLHAELAAILKARCEIYRITVERYNKKGEMMLAKPCQACWLAIKEAGITFVSYTTESGWVTVNLKSDLKG